MGSYVHKDGQAMANLSRYHPDWGMTPAEHEKAKAERARGDRKHEDKDARRRRLKPMADRVVANSRGRR